MSGSKAAGNIDHGRDASWQLRLRNTLSRERGAPAVCIQGGGARGSWEAGVLAVLLESGPNTIPSSIWGTSAGALNALWCRDPSVRELPARLLGYWVRLAWRLLSVLAVGGIALVTILAMLWYLPGQLLAAIGITVATLLIFVELCVSTGIMARRPGLVHPSVARMIVPRPSSIGPGPYVYTCVSDVESGTRPQFWDVSRRGWFCLDGHSVTMEAEEMSSGAKADAFHVAVASASLPIVVQHSRLAGMRLLDGGLIANLPAGFILSNGSLGGGYVLCVIPRGLHELSPSNAIDARTLRFLYEMREEQAKHRDAASASSSWSGPVHAHTPVFIVTPNLPLLSGLVKFWPSFLRRDFQQGVQDAQSFVAALSAFRQDDDEHLHGYLLENVYRDNPAKSMQMERAPWLKWANGRW
jgi:predicted patatin/cPLA2 family phospholipase